MNEYNIMVAGYTCMDMIPEFRKNGKSAIGDIFIPGRLTEVEGISFAPGGVVPNTGIALKKYNQTVYLNGLVGSDFLGNTLIESLKQIGLSEGIRITDKMGTAFGIVMALPDTDRIFLESLGCNQIFDARHINYEVAARCSIFHFGYPPLLKQFYHNQGRQLLKMFTEVQKGGTITSLDFSLPDPDSESGKIDWQRILRQVLPVVDICAPSLEEAFQMMMPEEYNKLVSHPDELEIIDRIQETTIMDIGKRMISYGAKVLLIKAAHRGVYLFTGNISSMNKRFGNTLDEVQWNYRQLWCKAYPIDPARVQNATGAGDTAIAAFLSSILKGNNPVNSMQYAALAGRNKLYCNNLSDELPDWNDMTEQLRTEEQMITNFHKE